jgi:hypothetical protein
MRIPEYITKQEVRRICKELGIRDWSKLKKPKVTAREGRIILKELNTKGLKIELDQFCTGLEVELEHGNMFNAANVTNNHPILTGKIVLAHFMESLDYYRRLEIAELEGDLHKAIAAKNSTKAKNYYKRIAKAKGELARAEGRQL